MAFELLRRSAARAVRRAPSFPTGTTPAPERCRLGGRAGAPAVPPPRHTAAVGHAGRLRWSPRHADFQPLVGAVDSAGERWASPGSLPSTAWAVLGQGLHQRWRHHPLAVRAWRPLVRHPGIRHAAAGGRLGLRHHPRGAGLASRPERPRLALPEGRGARGVQARGRDPEAEGALEAARTAGGRRLLGVAGMDGIAQAVRHGITGREEAGLLRASCTRQRVAPTRRASVRHRLGRCVGPAAPPQPILTVPTGPAATAVGGVGSPGRPGRRLLAPVPRRLPGSGRACRGCGHGSCHRWASGVPAPPAGGDREAVACDVFRHPVQSAI